MRRHSSRSREARNVNAKDACAWGRYGELYDYDSDDEEFTLEPGAQEYL